MAKKKGSRNDWGQGCSSDALISLDAERLVRRLTGNRRIGELIEAVIAKKEAKEAAAPAQSSIESAKILRFPEARIARKEERKVENAGLDAEGLEDIARLLAARANRGKRKEREELDRAIEEKRAELQRLERLLANHTRRLGMAALAGG